MTRGGPMHLHGRRLLGVEALQPYVPMDRPEFYTDSRRPCAPVNGKSALWTSSETTDLNVAAELCRRRCPFVRECLVWALEQGERHHVWGGLILSRSADRTKAERLVEARQQVAA
ncbi:WhiB family transcriptional regulator [Actinoplanes sp. CA-142083]|uniref:WhiB family transcriptional regulator n=1 Tax=Actinoplanes sp. CA-142083 TaxID=3239903 RepID=UPI003D8C5C87